MQLIDTHAHIATEAFDQDRSEVFARAAEAGVRRFLEIGYDLPSSRAAIALAEQHAEVYAVVGMQPNSLAEAPDGWLSQVRALASHPKVVAIGEIGMDYHWMRATPEVQEAAFIQQLQLARELGLPVVIHTREAKEDTLRILDTHARDQPGIMHSFSGDWEYAKACLEIGFLLSFSGPLTFPKTLELQEVARLAPLDMLLTETDSPYLSPHPKRGQRNEPARVRFVTERLASLREEPLEHVAAALWANAARIFRLDP